MINHKALKSIIVSSLLLMSTTVGLAAPKTDFNGDGKADVFLRNLFSGELSSWLITGTTFSSKPSYGSVSPSTGHITIGIKDANGDSRSDLYWYNINTGNVSAWFMNGGSVSSGASYGGLSPSLGWSLNSLTDFNRDGRFDLFWYNVYSGQMQIWYINGSAVTNKISLGSLPPRDGWYPIGLKDLDGNGYPDMLIFNPYTGGVVSRLDNGQIVSYGTNGPSSGWSPIGLEDINGDSKADLLWRNQYTGDIRAWLINGSTLGSAFTLGNNPPNSSWSIAGFADFNGDRKTDILWYHANTGATMSWLNVGIGNVNFGTGSPTQGWAPMGLDDFNGDGKADLLWYNRYTYATTTWLLNGAGISQTANYGSLAASSVWTINIPR